MQEPHGARVLVLFVFAAGCGPDVVIPPDKDVDGGVGDGGLDDGSFDEDAGMDAPLAPAPTCASLLPAGYTRRVPTLLTEVLWVSPPDATWNPFPNGGGVGRLATEHDQYIAIQFTTPADPTAWAAAAPTKAFFWDQSQVDGEPKLDAVYATISRCPGDFRVPTPDVIAPVNDPTLASGCTNYRRNASVSGSPEVSTFLYYTIGTGPSGVDACVLETNTTYYFNFIRARVNDGVVGSPDDERDAGSVSNCAQPDRTFCGIQARVQ